MPIWSASSKLLGERALISDTLATDVLLPVSGMIASWVGEADKIRQSGPGATWFAHRVSGRKPGRAAPGSAPARAAHPPGHRGAAAAPAPGRRPLRWSGRRRGGTDTERLPSLPG